VFSFLHLFFPPEILAQRIADDRSRPLSPLFPFPSYFFVCSLFPLFPYLAGSGAFDLGIDVKEVLSFLSTAGR